MKSPIKWAGGKSWFLSAFNYITRDVQYTRLVELFAGGAAIAFGRNEKSVLLNDSNVALYYFYRAVQQGRFPQEVKLVDDEYYRMRRHAFNDRVHTLAPDYEHVADDFYFLNKYGFNGLWRVNAKGEFNVPWNKRARIDYPDFGPYRVLLGSWQLECEDYRDVKLGATDLVFADPPYDGTFVGYTAGGFGWPEQLELARYLAGLSLPVVATNASTTRIMSLYRDLGFDVHTIEAPRRISCDGDRKPALEMVATKNLAPTGSTETT